MAPLHALLSICALAIAAGPAAAQDSFDYFYLVRQWPATYCNDHSCTHSPPRECVRQRGGPAKHAAARRMPQRAQHRPLWAAGCWPLAAAVAIPRRACSRGRQPAARTLRRVPRRPRLRRSSRRPPRRAPRPLTPPPARPPLPLPVLSSFSFTIHGLWPQRKDGTWPEYCDRARPFSLLRVLDLLPRLSRYWPSWAGPNKSFWAHEWERHGTCAEKVIGGQRAFFSAVLKLHQALKIEVRRRTAPRRAPRRPRRRGGRAALAGAPSQEDAAAKTRLAGSLSTADPTRSIARHAQARARARPTQFQPPGPRPGPGPGPGPSPAPL
jgi:hypothetical protein